MTREQAGLNVTRSRAQTSEENAAYWLNSFFFRTMFKSRIASVTQGAFTRSYVSFLLFARSTSLISFRLLEDMLLRLRQPPLPVKRVVM